MTQPLPPGVFAKALQERRAKQRRRKIIAWATGGVVVALVVFLGYVGWFSPWLTAQRVDVQGTDLLTVEEVTQAAAVELDVPLLRQDLGGIEARVRELPQVRDVSVGTEFPDTVVIQVTERQVVFQRELDGKVEWIDAEGVVFERTKHESKDVLQVSTDTTEQRLLTDIATVVAALPDDVAEKVRSFRADAVDQIEFRLSGDRSVIWGSAEESDLKAEVLSALLSVDADVYDVSAPRHPTTK